MPALARLFLLVVLVEVVVPRIALAQSSLSGCWAGTVGTAARQRRLAIELTQSGVSWQGRFHRLERSIESGDLTELAVSGDSLRFRVTIPSGDLNFSGRLADQTFEGTAVGASSEPFSLVRARPIASWNEKLVGRWFGALFQGLVPVLRIGLNITRAPCEQLFITMESPDQGSTDLPITSLTVAGDSLWFSMRYINGSFVGALSGDSLHGQWTQGGATLALRLGHRDSTLSTRRPQEPMPPFPYTASEVAYVNPVDSTRLAGTLTVPPGEGPFPAALLVTGSGAQDRNEALMGHKPFLVLADYLSRRGVAVLRVDDRGVGGSSGNIFTATIADNAGDALAGIEFLRNQPKVDKTRVGLVGHSEGGWVAPLAATQSPNIAFIVLLAGPAVSGEAIRQAQDSLLSLAAGGSINQVAASRRFTEAIHRALKAEPNDSVAIPRMIRAVEETYEALPPALKAATDSGSAARDSASLADRLRPLATPWYRYLLSFDPVPSLRRLRIPVLALFGERDLQVPPAQSEPVMRRALADNRRAKVHVFPGLNHLFQHAKSGSISEYGQIDETIAEEVLGMIASFIVTPSR